MAPNMNSEYKIIKIKIGIAKCEKKFQQYECFTFSFLIFGSISLASSSTLHVSAVVLSLIKAFVISTVVAAADFAVFTAFFAAFSVQHRQQL